MKTLADFKRDAASGKIKLELVERYVKIGKYRKIGCLCGDC